MNFQTEYKNIQFKIELEPLEMGDLTKFFGDKFHRLPNQTLIELKKGNLIGYNLIIESTFKDETRTHYWSKVLLTKHDDELIEDVDHYLQDEEILEQIVTQWNLVGDQSGPAWKQK
jgi:hypothetical protein